MCVYIFVYINIFVYIDILYDVRGKLLGLFSFSFFGFFNYLFMDVLIFVVGVFWI